MCSLSARTVSVLFVLPLPGYLFGAWLSAKLSFRLSQGKLMRLGIVFLALGSLIILLPGLFGVVSAASLAGGAAVYFIGSGILYPTATSCAIEPFRVRRAPPVPSSAACRTWGRYRDAAGSLLPDGRAGDPGAIMTLMVLIVALSFLAAPPRLTPSTDGYLSRAHRKDPPKTAGFYGPLLV